MIAIADGFVPTVIGVPAALVASVIGVTVPALQLHTYALVASTCSRAFLYRLLGIVLWCGAGEHVLSRVDDRDATAERAASAPVGGAAAGGDSRRAVRRVSATTRCS